MNKRMFRTIFIVVLLFCLSITSFAGPTPSVGDSSKGLSEATTKEDWMYSGSYAYGVRMGLYNSESGILVKSSNWLNTAPVGTCYGLGSNIKQNSRYFVNWDSMFSYEPMTGLPATGSGASAKEWAKGEQTLQKMCEVFGVTVDDFQSGKYLIGIEPIQQMNIGWKEHTVIGTATEVATYITTEFVKQWNDQIKAHVDAIWDLNEWPRDEMYNEEVAYWSLDASKADELVHSEMGNLTHHDLPCSFFLDPENPDGPDLGFSRVTDGFASCSEIRSQGYGLFILYADCPYKGIHPHGSPQAKDPDHPDHDPDQPGEGVLRTPFEKSV